MIVLDLFVSIWFLLDKIVVKKCPKKTASCYLTWSQQTTDKSLIKRSEHRNSSSSSLKIVVNVDIFCGYNKKKKYFVILGYQRQRKKEALWSSMYTSKKLLFSKPKSDFMLYFSLLISGVKSRTSFTAGPLFYLQYSYSSFLPVPKRNVFIHSFCSQTRNKSRYRNAHNILVLIERSIIWKLVWFSTANA